MEASGTAAPEGSSTRPWMEAWAKAAHGRNTNAANRRMNEFYSSRPWQLGREGHARFVRLFGENGLNVVAIHTPRVSQQFVKECSNPGKPTGPSVLHSGFDNECRKRKSILTTISTPD